MAQYVRTDEPAAAFSILGRSPTTAHEIPAYSTASASDAHWDTAIGVNDQSTNSIGPQTDMGTWELDIRFQAAVFSAIYEDRTNTASAPKEISESKVALGNAREDLLQLAWKCPRGGQFGKLFLRHVEELTEVAREYLEYPPPRFEQSGSKTRLLFSGTVRSKPNDDSPILSFFTANKPSLCESAPGSRWPQRLSVQRNSGFKGGGVRGLRRDAVNARNEGGMRSRIAVPAGLQAASKASQRKSNSKAAEKSDESDSEWEDSDDDLQYFSAEGE